MRTPNALIATTLVFLSLGCATSSPNSGVAHRADTALPPEVTPPSSVVLPGHLDRVLRDYERYWQAGDEEGLASLFVEGGLIVRNGTWIRGRASIREAYRTASGPLRLRAIEFAAGEELGYIIGAYGYGDEGPVRDSGMFVLTLRNDLARGWLIVSDLDRGASE